MNYYLSSSTNKHIVSVPKIMLLYGGTKDNVEPIHRLLNTELDRRKFGLVIIRVCPKINSEAIEK